MYMQNVRLKVDTTDYCSKRPQKKNMTKPMIPSAMCQLFSHTEQGNSFEKMEICPFISVYTQIHLYLDFCYYRKKMVAILRILVLGTD